MSGHSPVPQRAIDDWFAAHANAWDEAYRRGSVRARIYQRRQALAMRWVDGLNLPSGATVLEIGCGAGHATVALARKGFNVAATDPVRAMLCLAQARAREFGVVEPVRLTYADAHALAFSNYSFQLVLSLGVIPWLYSPAHALAEMARVLRPGGFLIISADNRLRLTTLVDPRLNPFLAPARRFLRQIGPGVRARNATLPRMHSPKEMRTMLEAAGFTVLAEATCGFGPFTAFGHPILGDPASVRLDDWLQQWAAADVPALGQTGAHYLALCSR